jgi:membrane protein implicated in regulation of membrane protease activity
VAWLKPIVREVFGLFVDDISFAGAIVLWLLLALLVLPRMAVGRSWEGVVLFAGLASILIESVLRFARRRSK